ncbi:MAG TPA: ATPase, partial [Deltaproteobacteria bacterium]|nr:ATPase [Deltaproteobacteria bacterium]
EGTYTLPEAQADRFMFKVVVGYPSRQEEREILKRATLPTPTVSGVLGIEELESLRRVLAMVRMDDLVADYIVDLVHATRPGGSSPLGPLVEFGASPRATIALSQASRAHAFLESRGYVTPDDVKAIAADVLRHRILLTYEAEADNLSVEDVITRVLKSVPTP